MALIAHVVRRLRLPTPLGLKNHCGCGDSRNSVVADVAGLTEAHQITLIERGGFGFHGILLEL